MVFLTLRHIKIFPFIFCVSRDSLQFNAMKVIPLTLNNNYLLINSLFRLIHQRPWLCLKERETYNARRQLLAHLGALVRQAAISIERERLNKERQTGVHSNFVELKLCCLVFRIAIEEAIVNHIKCRCALGVSSIAPNAHLTQCQT